MRPDLALVSSLYTMPLALPQYLSPVNARSGGSFKGGCEFKVRQQVTGHGQSATHARHSRGTRENMIPFDNRKQGMTPDFSHPLGFYRPDTKDHGLFSSSLGAYPVVHMKRRVAPSRFNGATSTSLHLCDRSVDIRHSHLESSPAQ